MKIKVGDIYSVRYTKTFGTGVRSYQQTFVGDYEVIRTGKKPYLFCNDNGQDWYPTKLELEEAINDYKK